MRVLKLIGMLPIDLVGLIVFVLLSPFNRGIEFYKKPITIKATLSNCTPLWFIMSKLTNFNIAGVTIGHFVFIKKQFENDVGLMVHERVHVEQQEEYSIIYPTLYAYYSIKAKLNHEDPYLSNKFEQEAYRKQVEFMDS